MRKTLSIVMTLVAMLTFLCFPASAYDDSNYLAGISSVMITPARLESNRSITWYYSSSFKQAVYNSVPDNISTNLGNLKNLVPPSTANGWTGYFIEVNTADSGAVVSTNRAVQSAYRNSDCYGFYLPYGSSDITITSKYGNYTYTCYIDLSMSGGSGTLKPSGTTRNFGPY